MTKSRFIPFVGGSFDELEQAVFNVEVGAKPDRQKVVGSTSALIMSYVAGDEGRNYQNVFHGHPTQIKFALRALVTGAVVMGYQDPLELCKMATEAAYDGFQIKKQQAGGQGGANQD